MTLNDYITEIKEQYKIKATVQDILKYIQNKAKQEAKGSSCVAIDDDTVKDWIINVDYEVKSAPAQEVVETVKPEIIKPVVEEKPVKEQKAKKVKDNAKNKIEELSLFDLLTE